MLERPVEIIDALIAHRLLREQKTRDALRRAGAATIEELLIVVYEDIDPALHELASCSLLAHLLKLEREGHIGREGDAWLDRG
jgi:hypothetical protein